MEPTLHAIDDYNNTESKEKRKIVNSVIAGLFIAGLVYAGVKVYFEQQTTSFYVPSAERTAN